ncbi:hypothetical protein FPV67DRAFT_1666914 [Lyophyllum atratum]|nr:hypothetical protein FPV67DRAFT_1666914 [Lyophyllum atratum]
MDRRHKLCQELIEADKDFAAKFLRATEQGWVGILRADKFPKGFSEATEGDAAEDGDYEPREPIAGVAYIANGPRYTVKLYDAGTRGRSLTPSAGGQEEIQATPIAPCSDSAVGICADEAYEWGAEQAFGKLYLSVASEDRGRDSPGGSRRPSVEVRAQSPVPPVISASERELEERSDSGMETDKSSSSGQDDPPPRKPKPGRRPVYIASPRKPKLTPTPPSSLGIIPAPFRSSPMKTKKRASDTEVKQWVRDASRLQQFYDEHHATDRVEEILDFVCGLGAAEHAVPEAHRIRKLLDAQRLRMLQKTLQATTTALVANKSLLDKRITSEQRVLRPRKAGRANQQLRASASTPSVQEFEQLHRVEPLMVRDEVETQNKGKPVWVEFYDNDDIFVRHVDIPTKPEPGDYWKAKIQAVRSDHGTGKTWVAVKWYYSRTDFEDTKWKTSLEKAIIPCLGDAELVLSDHVDIIEPRCIESPLKVVAFNDLLRVSHVPRGAWFMRLTVELSTAKRGSLKGVNGSCVCGQIYDPKEDIQRYCPECECWYHHACMDINMPYERDATLSPAAAIAQIPCVRGLTSHTGSVSGPGARLSELEGWLEEDKLPDNWRERLGERFCTKAEETDWGRYQCPTCASII